MHLKILIMVNLAINSIRENFKELMVKHVIIEYVLNVVELTIPLRLVLSNMDFPQVLRTRAKSKALVQVLIWMSQSPRHQKLLHWDLMHPLMASLKNNITMLLHCYNTPSSHMYPIQFPFPILS